MIATGLPLFFDASFTVDAALRREMQHDEAKGLTIGDFAGFQRRFSLLLRLRNLIISFLENSVRRATRVSRLLTRQAVATGFCTEAVGELLQVVLASRSPIRQH
jgi:hypothetical protein